MICNDIMETNKTGYNGYMIYEWIYNGHIMDNYVNIYIYIYKSDRYIMGIYIYLVIYLLDI